VDGQSSERQGSPTRRLNVWCIRLLEFGFIEIEIGIEIEIELPGSI
jgi:hypothetical protein